MSEQRDPLRMPHPQTGIEGNPEPILRWGPNAFRPSEMPKENYNEAMRNGDFVLSGGPPPRPGTVYGPPGSGEAAAAWDAKYERIGPDGYFDYGPRYHGPDKWAHYKILTDAFAVWVYDPKRLMFVPTGKAMSREEALRMVSGASGKPPVPQPGDDDF